MEESVFHSGDVRGSSLAECKARKRRQDSQPMFAVILSKLEAQVQEVG